MPTGFPRSPKFLKGALIKLEEGFLGPIPNVIVFQYNPEKLSRQFQNSAEKTKGVANKETVKTDEPFDPEESFNIALELDATDSLENPIAHPTAVISGIADRIAALEMLLYPIEENRQGSSVTNPIHDQQDVPKKKVPVLLFVWGPGRIIPVRITTFSVEEQDFSQKLYPIRASVTLGLKVLKPDSFPPKSEDRTTIEELAVTSYKYSKSQKEVLARLNLANSAESILAMLPF